MKKYELVTVADVIEFGRDFREIIKSKSLDELRQWAKDRDSKGQLSDIVMAASFGASYEKILTDKEYETFKDYNWRQFVLSPDEKEKAQYKDISSRVEGNVIIPPLTFPYGVEKIWFSLKTEQELKSELLEACAKGDIDTVSSLVELSNSNSKELGIKNESVWLEAFLVASKANHLEVAQKLVNKVDPTYVDGSGTSVLEYILKFEDRSDIARILRSMVYEDPNLNIPQKDPIVQKRVKKTIEQALNTAKKLWEGTGYSSKDEASITSSVMKGVIADAAAVMGGTLSGQQSMPHKHFFEKDRRKGIIYDLERFLAFEVPHTMLGMIYNVSDPSSGEGKWVDKLSKLKPPKVGANTPPFTGNEKDGKSYHAAIHWGFTPTTGFEEMIKAHRKRSGLVTNLYQPASPRIPHLTTLLSQGQEVLNPLPLVCPKVLSLLRNQNLRRRNPRNLFSISEDWFILDKP